MRTTLLEVGGRWSYPMLSVSLVSPTLQDTDSSACLSWPRAQLPGASRHLVIHREAGSQTLHPSCSPLPVNGVWLQLPTPSSSSSSQLPAPAPGDLDPVRQHLTAQVIPVMYVLVCWPSSG